LKDEIEITQARVECPVKGCFEKIERQRRTFKREDRFKCPEHKIYISLSTFEYENEEDNLLWKETSDTDLLRRIKAVKRESRMARDNSEDAVTWNVFRFLERNNLVSSVIGELAVSPVENPEVIYWSYYQKENTGWSELNKAREEFGERLERGSEPDIIIKSDNALFFIEAKLTAGNETVPSDKSSSKKYETGGDNWFSRVFKSDFKRVAIEEQKYELLRLWLLGTWTAKQQGLNFYLVNLVLSRKDEKIETLFKAHIHENEGMRFIRLSWEDIYQQILTGALSGTNKDLMIQYFRNKTIGYDKKGTLQRAFSVP
jgi:hypothetical protein